ncbi:hypothetical protein J6590_026195 [Homalodisca vitripennis]|nr:hypothetical protein J6590_026195 [Homalodisca vitripennis]
MGEKELTCYRFVTEVSDNKGSIESTCKEETSSVVPTDSDRLTIKQDKSRNKQENSLVIQDLSSTEHLSRLNVEDKSLAIESVLVNSSNYSVKEESSEGNSVLFNTKVEVNASINESLPGSSSNHSVKEESCEEHLVWLPSSTIKKEEDVAEKDSESEGSDSQEENDGVEDESEAEMNNDSDGGAYHLAEVSYGEDDDDDEDSDKTERKGAGSTLGNSHGKSKLSQTNILNHMVS